MSVKQAMKQEIILWLLRSKNYVISFKEEFHGSKVRCSKKYT